MTKIDLLALTFIIGFVVCIMCSDICWRRNTKQHIRARMAVFHIANAIASVAFLWFWFLLLTSPR